MKTKEQVLKLASAYLSKTSQHLFTTEDGKFFKIETIEQDGKLYYVTIKIGDKVVVNVQEVVSEMSFKFYGNNTLNVMKGNLFPQHTKIKSIPYFKKMKSLIKEIMVDVSTDNKKNLLLSDIFVNID